MFVKLLLKGFNILGIHCCIWEAVPQAYDTVLESVFADVLMESLYDFMESIYPHCGILTHQ